MNFFDGKCKSQPLINLSGASKQRTKEELLKQVAIEREKRERERKQQLSAIKIQSAFKSFLVRKKLKIECRHEFDQLFTNNKTFCVQDLITILPYFVNIYDQKLDIDRLTKISQFIIQQKQTVIDLLCRQNSQSFSFTFAKFLVINLKVLNQKSIINHAIPLRLIEYFTDPKIYPSSEISIFIFNYLIKNNYISQLVNYCLSKIAPNMSKRSANIPIAQSISDLFLRIFFYLDSKNPELNKNIVNCLCNELFTKVYKTQIRYCVIERLSTLMRSIKGDHISLFLTTFITLNQTAADDHRLVADHNTRDLFQNYNFNLFNLYSILKLYHHTFENFTNEQFKTYLNVIRILLNKIPILDESCEQNEYFLVFSNDVENLNKNNEMNEIEMEEEEETSRIVKGEEGEDFMNADRIDINEDENEIDKFDNKINRNLLNDILELMDSKEFSNKINNYFNQNTIQSTSRRNNLNEICFYTSHICYFVLIKSSLKMHQSVLLRTIAFNKTFLHLLWKNICSLSIRPNENQEIFLVQLLASGSTIEIYDNNLFKLIPPLITFCSLYNLFLLPILDEEFIKGEAIFTKLDLIQISSTLKDICLGIIHLMHPDTKPLTSSNIIMGSSSAAGGNNFDIKIKAIYFTHLFQSCSQLVQRMYTRDIRRAYCPEDHWLSNTIIVKANRLTSVLQADKPILTTIKFGNLSYLFQKNNDFDVKLSVNDVRSLTVLQELPFVVPFKERVQILESFFAYEPFNVTDRSYRIRIRRDYLYEDALDNLSLDNAPNLKTARINVEMINMFGADEAGIDGGGLFREFMLKVLETGFDPNRGFFILTSDGFLYPNPNVRLLVESYHQHYFFLGRMLAKAIQSKILSELKFADFFLQKILTKFSDTRLDIDYLASLDPVVYKNLLYLKDLKLGNVEDLGLNFSVDTNEFGETRTVELKPGGRDIPVTNDNKIEYIHLLADFKLNKQINDQVLAFRNGMSNVIDLEYLRLFNFHELENLISGTVEVIDVADWRRYTVYNGEYNESHPAIQTFWEVVDDFDEENKRKLLKFATSRSRPPLFGFKNLIPNFAIHNSGSEDRLPSASTCLNLLKLPPITDYHVLKSKLICAIEAEAGFELS